MLIDVLIDGRSYSKVWKIVLDCHYRHYLWKLIIGVLENEYSQNYFYQIFFFGKTLIVHYCSTVISNTSPHWGTTDSYAIAALCVLDCLVINKCFYPIIKPLRDISFLHIMFCCQCPFMPYAKYTKNWVLFFGIVKQGKVLESRGLIAFFLSNLFSFQSTAFFLSKLFPWKRIIRTRLTLYCNAVVVFVCRFFLIFVYCS